MNPAPPVTSTFIVRFAVLGTSAREAASLPASADDSVRLRPSSAAFPDAYRAGRREAPRPDDVVPARRGRRRRDVRARRGRGAAGRRGRGARRLAGELPPLRDRLRRRHRQQPARRAVEGACAAAVLPLVRARCAQGGTRSGRRPRALASERRSRAGDREAGRAPALGLGCGPRVACSTARAVARPPCARRRLCVDGPRGRRAITWGPRCARHRARREDSRLRGRARRAAPRPLRRPPLRGEGRARAGGGCCRAPARRRR